MCFIILPEELEKKAKIVNQYEVSAGKFKEGTPEYVLQYSKEIDDFYDRETDGFQ